MREADVLIRQRHEAPPRERPDGSVAAEPSWVVYLSAIRWEGARNRQQELAEQVARSRRVLFVEAPGLGIAWRLRVDGLGASLWRAGPLALLPLGRFVPWVNRVNRRYSGWRLRRWLDRRPGARIVIVDEDLAAPLAGRLGARARVYDAADLDWTFTRPWNRGHLRSALASAVDDADIVLTSSSVLAEHLPPSRGPVVELLNACDVEHFERDASAPSVIDALPRPLLGYVGALDRRAFDAGLVAEVAGAHPGWTFVLAGHADPRVASELAGLPNVHLVGPVAYESLPGLLGAFDVCLIPYVIGGRIDYVQPKKLFEYLAAGKPVVATELPALSLLDVPHHRASSAAAFAAAITSALHEGVSDAAADGRRRCARAHTWDARGLVLRRILDEIESCA
jgi:glycosyltransferase involved in cell wall biosynthesis